MKSSKTRRFFQSFKGVESGRKGECTPETCETSDGRKGAACCKLGFVCPCLGERACKAYRVRPPNCRVFPRSREDLLLVKGCGFHWEEKIE